MNISIIVEAQHIPDGTIVMKETGQKPYTLRTNGLKVYTEDGHMLVLEGSCILQAEASINVISPSTLLRIRCESICQAKGILESIKKNYFEEEDEDEAYRPRLF